MKLFLLTSRSMDEGEWELAESGLHLFHQDLSSMQQFMDYANDI